MKGWRLYEITDPTGIDCTILAPDALSALHIFHGQALGFNKVRRLNGGLVFRDRADQELCAGRWTVCEQAVDDGTDALVVEIEPPE